MNGTGVWFVKTVADESGGRLESWGRRFKLVVGRKDWRAA